MLRLDRLAIDLPTPKNPSPNSASAVQELLGGRFGELSTLMNYTFQSFNLYVTPPAVSRAARGSG